ncbi:GyrI-like domain-containing protein [Enterococcus olivae]
MTYKIEKLRDSKFVYMRATGVYGTSKNFQMMTDFKQWLLENDFWKEVLENGIICIAQDDPEKIAAEACRYDLVVFTKKEIPDDSRIDTGNFSGGTYAVFSMPHTTQAVQSFWSSFEETVLQNKLSLREHPILERYKEEIGEKKKCEFLIPID